MSKTALRKMIYSISKTVDAANLSYQSAHDYKQILRASTKVLNDQGYTLHSLKQLKQKHLNFLVNQWKREQLSIGSIKNRLSAFRLAARLMKKPDVVKSNNDYGIGVRSYIPTVSKAVYDCDFSKVKNPYIRMSLELQKVFGLRREESLKIKPHQADCGFALKLQASWTKGKVERVIPINTTKQRNCLANAKILAGKGGSLIPPHKSYKQQRTAYDNAVRLAGFKNMHGLRHAYAQSRYEELTHQLTKGHGWKSPIMSGPTRKKLNGFEKQIDCQVRMIVSLELGHSRVSIVKNYIG
jgi:hypothetical protein